MRPSEETTAALLEWVRSFGGTAADLGSLEELCDGICLNEILTEVAPHHFTADGVSKSAASNWAIAQTNLKKIVKNLETHFAEDLSFRAPFDQVDLTAISKEKDLSELMKLLELVAVAAIKSPDRARHYVERIMGLSPASQPILKALIETGMQKATTLDDLPPPPPASSAEVEELKAAVRAADEECSKAKTEVEGLKLKLRKADEQIEDLSHTVETQRKRLETAERDLDGRRLESDRVRSRFEQEVERLQQKVDGYKDKAYEDKLFRDKAAAEKERMEKLEQDLRRMADELDVAKAGTAELSKLQDTVEKYKAKLDAMSSAKQHIKDLEDRGEKYLEQIMSLEDQVKTIPGLQKLIEQYKQEKVDMENARFEEFTASKLKDAEILKLRDELESAQSAKRFLSDELSALRKSQADGQTDDSVNGLGLFEDSTEIKEKCARLAKENKALKQLIENKGVGSEEAQILKSQLHDTMRIKQDREQEIINVMGRCAELEAEVDRLRDLAEEAQSALPNATDAENTIRHLRTSLTQQERLVATLSSDKEKLEQYIKSRLEKLEQVHKEYLATLARLKEERAELKERNEFLEEKIRKDKEQHKREERLLHSAFYEIGLDAFESRLSAPSATTARPTTLEGSTRSNR